jgi:hypothetical protein
MRISYFIALVAMLVTAVGCQRSVCNQAYSDWFWQDASGTKAHFDGYKHVLLVRVDEDHWVDGGKHRLSQHHYTGTVERAFKGDWKIAEPIAFVQGFDYSFTTNANLCAGEQLVLLMEEHTNSEIGIDTGDLLAYDGPFRQVMQCVFGEAER